MPSPTSVMLASGAAKRLSPDVAGAGRFWKGFQACIETPFFIDSRNGDVLLGHGARTVAMEAPFPYVPYRNRLYAGMFRIPSVIVRGEAVLPGMKRTVNEHITHILTRKSFLNDV
jgi:hypothetical protein